MSGEPEPVDHIATRVDGDCVIIANRNTTIGYARFDRELGMLDYVFVHPAYRNLGYGRQLVAVSEAACGKSLTPAHPISPLGRRLFPDAKRADG